MTVYSKSAESRLRLARVPRLRFGNSARSPAEAMPRSAVCDLRAGVIRTTR